MAAYDWDPNVIFGQAPKTNVGIVSLGNNQYVAPRDPRAKDLLNYAAPSEPVFYDRPEELEFAPDPNEPGTYNTELNPYDPSSKFFPYEPDYAGLMSLKQYTEDIGDVQKVPLVSELMEDEYGRAHSKLVPKDPSYGYYEPWDRNITFNPEAHKGYGTEEIRDTLFHEGKHYFIDNFGNLVPLTKELDDDHTAIYLADMFRKNPFWRTASGAINPNMMVNKPSALAFMQMHNLGKKWSQDQKPFEEGKESKKETWKRLVTDNADPNDTLDQLVAQFDAYHDPDRGNVQAPTMTQQQMVQEAQQTGGTINPHEATQAAWTPSAPTQSDLDAVMAKGGLVSVNHLTRRL